MVRPLSPIFRAIGKIGGVNQTIAAMGGGVTEVMVRYWLKRDFVPPERAVVLARCSGIRLEEFAEHEKQKYLAQAEAHTSACLPDQQFASKQGGKV